MPSKFRNQIADLSPQQLIAFMAMEWESLPLDYRQQLIEELSLRAVADDIDKTIHSQIDPVFKRTLHCLDDAVSMIG